MENPCKSCKFCGREDYDDTLDAEMHHVYGCSNTESNHYQETFIVTYVDGVLDDGRIKQTCEKFIAHD